MTYAFNQDCMIAMKEFPDKYFELAIVDPPYGIDLANMNMGIGKSKKASKAHNRKWIAKDWDKKAPTKKYFAELRRVSINQIIWGGNYFELPPCKNYTIWDKKIPSGLSFADCEMAWTSFDTVTRQVEINRGVLINQNTFHPTEKPFKLYRWLLSKYAKQGDKILDTHLGSGSSRIAAHQLGFEFYGYELDKDYFEAQEKRFKLVTSQEQIVFPK